MGLFDLFRGKGSGSDGEKKGNAAAKWAEAAGSKRAQAYDRQEAIGELCKLKTSDAVEALLRRFTFAIDPSITDLEEKDAAFEGIVSAGREALVPVRAFAAKAESIAQPLRILRAILTEEELIQELLLWLERWDTEYAKFIDPKLQILQALEEYRSPAVRLAVEPFLQDVNEPARFHAVTATLAQNDIEARGPLLAALIEEESVRVRGKIADGFVSTGWDVPDELRDSVRKCLPFQYVIDGEGLVRKRT
jgi:hypothetical protein